MTIKSCLIYAAIAIAGAAPAMAQERFDSPEEAAQAVIDAAYKHDSDRLWAILVPKRREFSAPATPRRIAPSRPSLRRSRTPNIGSKSVPLTQTAPSSPLAKRTGHFLFPSCG
jgi:hypothetical protein